MMLYVHIERNANDCQILNFYLTRGKRRVKGMKLDELRLMAATITRNEKMIEEVPPGSQMTFEIMI